MKFVIASNLSRLQRLEAPFVRTGPILNQRYYATHSECRVVHRLEAPFVRTGQVIRGTTAHSECECRVVMVANSTFNAIPVRDVPVVSGAPISLSFREAVLV